MNRPRLALAPMAALAVGLAGCLPPASPGRPVVARRPTELGGALALTPPDGPAVAVAQLAWGGPPGARTLGVRFADGRLAAYRPDLGPDPVGISPPGAVASALAVTGGGVVVSADGMEVVAWAGSGGGLVESGRFDLGPITSLAGLPDDDSAVVAGLADGRLVRLRVGPAGEVEVEAESRPGPSPAPIVGIVPVDGGRALVAMRSDGGTERHRAELGGFPVESGPARAVVPWDVGRVARLVDGPAVEVDPAGPGGRPRRVALPAPAGSLAVLRESARVVAACGDALLLIPFDGAATTRAATIRSVAGEGWLVAADPEGRRLATASAGGRVEVFEPEALGPRAGPWDLDGAAGLAFEPHRRFHRSRPGSSPPDLAEGLARRLDEAREAIDLGRFEGLAGRLRAIEADPGLNRHGAAEAAAMLAALEHEAGRAPDAILPLLDRASQSFGRLGLVDRRADMEFWAASLLAPRFDGRDGPGPKPEARVDAIARLARAAALYREAGPHLERQALLCEALRAWTLLSVGRAREAARAFRPAAVAARVDPVLGQSAELDRIASALAASQGDWQAAASADGRALGRLEAEAEPRPLLLRQVALALAGDLAALGDWEGAARVLDPARPVDPEWSLRRAVARARLGRDPEPADGPHARAALLLAEVGTAPAPEAYPVLRRALAELGRAAESGRDLGRDDLAIEADLARAEALERLGVRDEALAAHAEVVRACRALGTPDFGRLSAQPARALGGRPYRGLARGYLAAGRPGAALAALDAGERAEFLTRTPADDPSARSAEVVDPGRDLDPASLRLGPDEALLAFQSAGPEAVVAFLARPGLPIEARRVGLPRRELARAIRLWRSGLGDGGRSVAPAPGSPAALAGLSEEPEPADDAPPRARTPALESTWEAYLDDALFRPFAADLADVARLSIVAGGPLEGMPLEVAGRGRRLLRRHSVAYRPLAGLAPTGATAGPEAGRRALFVSTEPPGHDGADGACWADPAAVHAWADRYRSAGYEIGPGSGVDSVRVVHASWRVDGEAPRSADPVVGLERWRPPEVRADVLVLSLSGPAVMLDVTARSPRSAGLEALGSGGLAAIVCLWDPPAASGRVFLDELHARLAEGDPPPAALAKARDRVARDPSFRDPVHWAGFVLYGRP